MNKRLIQMFGLLAALLLAACGKNVHSPQGFRLPDGDVDAGRAAFARVGCIQCHSVAGEDGPSLAQPRTIEVKLGGKVREVETYAQLVTSIIYPTHAIKDGDDPAFKDESGNSLMPDLTADMTVRELIDIAAYLQSHYEVVVPVYPEYPFTGSYYP